MGTTPTGPNQTIDEVRNMTALRVGGRFLSGTILLIIILYSLVTVAFAAFLVRDAYLHFPTEFEKVTVSAAIAVVGTVLTTMSALYTANRQAGISQRIELLRFRLTGDLDLMKAQSAEGLERLKASLDITKTAYRELFGAATTYFYTLRELASGPWDAEPHKKANALMVEAARHLLYVSGEMRDKWLAFWTDANFIYTETLKETDTTKRKDAMAALISNTAATGRDFRALHLELEKIVGGGVNPLLNDAS
jgi:hypothetical protein